MQRAPFCQFIYLFSHYANRLIMLKFPPTHSPHSRHIFLFLHQEYNDFKSHLNFPIFHKKFLGLSFVFFFCRTNFFFSEKSPIFFSCFWKNERFSFTHFEYVIKTDFDRQINCVFSLCVEKGGIRLKANSAIYYQCKFKISPKLIAHFPFSNILYNLFICYSQKRAHWGYSFEQGKSGNAMISIAFAKKLFVFG